MSTGFDILLLKPIAADLAKQLAEACIKRLAGAALADLYTGPLLAAIRATSETFSSRLPEAGDALRTWAASETFKLHVDSLLSGAPTLAPSEHAKRFVEETGLKFGTASDLEARHLLDSFYSALNNEFFNSKLGNQIIGNHVLRIREEVSALPDQIAARVAEKVSVLVVEQSARPNFPGSLEDLRAAGTLDNARDLIQIGKIAAARDILDTLRGYVEEGSISADLRVRYFTSLGACELLERNLGAAEAALVQALAITPTEVNALVNMAQVARAQGDRGKALSCVSKALSRNSRLPVAAGLYLALLTEAGDAELPRYLGSNEWIYDEPDSLYLFGEALAAGEDWLKAEDCARRVTVKNSKFGDGFDLLGRAILGTASIRLRLEAITPELVPIELRDMLIEARNCFSNAYDRIRATDRDRQKAAILANQALVETFLREFASAKCRLLSALELNPDEPQFFRILGVLALSEGDPIGASNYLDRIPDPKLRAEAAPQIGIAYLESGRYIEARQFLLPVLESTSDPQSILVLSDLLLSAADNLQDAVLARDLRRRIENIPAYPVQKLLIFANHAHRCKDDVLAESLFTQAVEESSGVEQQRARLVFGNFLYKTGSFSGAVVQYRNAITTPEQSEDVKRYAAALTYTGGFQTAVNICRHVRGWRPAIRDFSEIEACALEGLGELKEAIELRKDMLRLGLDSRRQQLSIASDLLRVGLNTEAREYVRTVSLESVKSDPDLLFAAARLRTALEMPDALTFAFEMLQQDRNSPDAHLAYIGIFQNRELIDEPLLKPSLVAVETQVCLRFGSQTERFVISDSPSDLERRVLNREQELAAALLGKSVGETVTLHPAALNETIYEILEIKSKYVQTFQDIIGGFAERFPTETALVRFTITDRIPNSMVQMLELRRAHVERILNLYAKGKLPAATVARLVGQEPAELFESVVENPELRVLASEGTQESRTFQRSVFERATAFIIEESALVTLGKLGLLDAIRAANKIIIATQQSIDSVRRIVDGIQPERQGGSILSDAPGRIRVIERSTEQVRERRDFFLKLWNFAVSVEQVGVGGLEEDESKKLNAYGKFLGLSSQSVLLSAKAQGVPIFSDDLPLRIIGQTELGVESFGVQALLTGLRTAELIDDSTYHSAITWLVCRKYHVILIAAGDIVWALREAGWNTDARVASMISALAGPECDEDNAIVIGAQVLAAIHGSIAIAAGKQLLSDLVIGTLVANREAGRVLQKLSQRVSITSLVWTPVVSKIQASISAWGIAKRMAGQ